MLQDGKEILGYDDRARLRIKIISTDGVSFESFGEDELRLEWFAATPDGTSLSQSEQGFPAFRVAQELFSADAFIATDNLTDYREKADGVVGLRNTDDCIDWRAEFTTFATATFPSNPEFDPLAIFICGIEAN